VLPYLLYLSLPYLLLYVYVYDTVFNTCSWTQIYRYTCAYLHATWLSPYHSLGSSDSSGSICPDPGAWNLWILPVTG